MSENVVSQPDARPKICRVVVIVGSSAGVSGEAREVQALDAGRIPKGKLPLAGKRWIENEILAGAVQTKIPVYFIRTSYNKALGGVLPDDIWKPAVEATGGRFYAAGYESMILTAIKEI